MCRHVESFSALRPVLVTILSRGERFRSARPTCHVLEMHERTSDAAINAPACIREHSEEFISEVSRRNLVASFYGRQIDTTGRFEREEGRIIDARTHADKSN